MALMTVSLPHAIHVGMRESNQARMPRVLLFRPC